ncbi:hypothetical protein LTR96_011239 [Exophiala xenobiotica]|nr:hypothetical protein LTR92_010933 [Exophiala xenobiotica]KAK5263346.1 hypothetical protein LTR96_011239 [Exophiala xenobiotica]KAK5332769.1 hypothetical protein LTR98_011106 [Exophiala xenobiotica]KAK5399973.1 hypothetical protein LTR06_011366 [Exophiala xenobiotica]
MAAFIISLQFFTITIAKVADFPSTSQTIYAMCLALAATICQRFILGEIQALYILRTNASIISATLERPVPSYLMKVENAKWRTVMRVSSLAQSVQNVWIYLSYVVAALITTAVISACTASKTAKTMNVVTSILSGAPDSCLLVLNEMSNDFWQWDIGNGSWYSLQPSMDSCPTRQAVTLAGTINTVNPAHFVYADLGVAVLPGAVGAPSTIYSPNADRAPTLSASFEEYADGLVSIEECAPVLAQNPVSCRPGGTISHNETYMLITSSDGLCSDGRFWSVDLDTPEAPAVQNALCTKDDVGQSIIVMSALWGWGYILATTVDDQEYLRTHNVSGDNNGYILTCEVNMSSAIETQIVTLEMSNYDPEGSGYSKKLTSTGQHCIIGDNFLEWGPAYLAYAALSSWQIIIQNYGNGGWFETINELANAPNPDNATNLAWVPRNTSNLAFPDSQNALEDVYGLIAGLIMSRIGSGGSSIQSNANITAQFYRVGGGHRFGTMPESRKKVVEDVIYGAMGKELKVDDLTDLLELGRLQLRNSED